MVKNCYISYYNYYYQHLSNMRLMLINDCRVQGCDLQEIKVSEALNFSKKKSFIVPLLSSLVVCKNPELFFCICSFQHEASLSLYFAANVTCPKKNLLNLLACFYF